MSDKATVQNLREVIYDYAGETSHEKTARILREEANCLEELEVNKND